MPQDIDQNEIAKPLTENGEAVQTHYSKRACPELSKATLGAPSIIAGSPSRREMQPCIGVRCMWFVPEVNEANEIVNGACAIAQQAFHGANQANLLGALLQKILEGSKLRLTPRASF